MDTKTTNDLESKVTCYDVYDAEEIERDVKSDYVVVFSEAELSVCSRNIRDISQCGAYCIEYVVWGDGTVDDSAAVDLYVSEVSE